MTFLASGNSGSKIILMGEHSVVYEQPAIAIQFKGVSIQADLFTAKNWELESIYYKGLLEDAPENLENIKELIAELDKKYSIGPKKIVINSSIPSERGMGSSAAVAVAVAKACLSYLGIDISKEEFLNYINISEKIAHGNPSGIDAAAVSSSDPIYFIKNKKLESFPMNLAEGFLIVADTGIKGQTRLAVSDVRNLVDSDDIRYKEAIDNLGFLVNEARKFIEIGDLKSLGQTMNQAQADLRTLSVSSKELDLLVDTALSAGALGAKLTGGGRGGCMIALTSDVDSAKKVQSALDKYAEKTYMVSLGEDK